MSLSPCACCLLLAAVPQTFSSSLARHASFSNKLKKTPNEPRSSHARGSSSQGTRRPPGRGAGDISPLPVFPSFYSTRRKQPETRNQRVRKKSQKAAPADEPIRAAAPSLKVWLAARKIRRQRKRRQRAVRPERENRGELELGLDWTGSTESAAHMPDRPRPPYSTSAETLVDDSSELSFASS
ncbi:hypothetical protein B0T11DRAFT_278373 [Plectosphaerella cucumerina]|uniref:Uncharacterized protein n=1 Tax=Plectosphaerella cucumerina TaxID=40658 RepID=A0A8K0TPU0_9PEZI|nr:hypothetical protein B0T11DRAFT_278373 [Plectosphaerella cucumerina]